MYKYKIKKLTFWYQWIEICALFVISQLIIQNKIRSDKK